MRRRRRWLWLSGGLLLAGALGFVAFVWWMQPGTHRVDRDVELPVRYDGDRYYAEPITARGATLSLLADTGGGLLLTENAVSRCGIAPKHILGKTLARLPTFQSDHSIPEPTGGERWMRVVPGDGDGMLGQRWFAGGVWTFDYPHRKLLLRHAPFAPSPQALQHSTKLGFRKEYGMRTSNHPRFVVTIEGQPLDALFDTGATAWLTPQALSIVNDGAPAERATSFVRASLFERWRAAHPLWRVIEKGCARSGESLIEVPQVQVAGFGAGPVWFTRRADAHLDWMSTFMDKPLSASIGGNFLRHFRITVDYPAAVAYFEASESP